MRENLVRHNFLPKSSSSHTARLDYYVKLCKLPCDFVYFQSPLFLLLSSWCSLLVTRQTIIFQNFHDFTFLLDIRSYPSGVNQVFFSLNCAIISYWEDLNNPFTWSWNNKFLQSAQSLFALACWMFRTNNKLEVSLSLCTRWNQPTPVGCLLFLVSRSVQRAFARMSFKYKLSH